MKTRVALVCALTALVMSACQPASVDRTGKILSMAGEEAANIPNKLDRFSRQLNIANIQLITGRAADADRMLLLARDTLSSAAKGDMDDFHRIAGWTAIAQLALRAQDRDLALKAADLSLAALNDVQPEAERAQYVLSLSMVLSQVRDRAAAVELVNSGGAWAGKIVDANIRRQALLAFASQLLAFEAFENARTLLRQDVDPAWRTDALLALSNATPVYVSRNIASYTSVPGTIAGGGRGDAGGGFGVAEEMKQDMLNLRSAAPSYGRDVRFESVYQQSGN